LWNYCHRAGQRFPHELGNVCHLYHRCALGQPIRVSFLTRPSLSLPFLQAEGQKSPRPILRQTRQNLPDISKGHSQLGMCEFDPFQVSRDSGIRPRSLGNARMAGNAGFSRARFRLRTPKSAIGTRQSANVSGHAREYSRFAETVGGDRVRSRPAARPWHSVYAVLLRRLKANWEYVGWTAARRRQSQSYLS
jgi:hypothetical protein